MRRVLVLVLAAAVAVAAQSGVQPGGAVPGPLPLFPADNWWNQDVTTAPVDPASDAFIAFIGASRRAHPDFGGYESPGSIGIYGFPYVVVPGNQPKRAVQFYYPDESDGVDHGTGQSLPFYPIPDEAITQPYFIEGGAPGNQAPGGDRHMLILDRDNRDLYELYDLRWTGSGWSAGSGAYFDLDQNGRRPDGWTSADAAGLAIFPGLVRYDEVFGPDEIRHAFRVTVRATNGYVWPASHRAGSNPQALPMGARLRLKSSRDLSGFPPEARKIFRAMQRYGLIVADNGSDLYVSGAFDARWDNDVLNPAFAALTASDFEVISLGWRGGASPAPCETPGAPRDFAAAASGTMAVLNWAAPAAGGAVAEYVLEAGSSSGLADLAAAPVGQALSFSTSAPPGAYYLRVRARNACGTGPASVEQRLVVGGGCAAPPAVGAIQTAVTGRVVSLAWPAAAGASDYVLEVGSAPGLADLLVTAVAGPALTAGAPPGTYYVRVRGRSACGLGAASPDVPVVVP
ncbi:MAG: hypothetical protein AB7H88_13465 [Vicinamibacterales bacterium]